MKDEVGMNIDDRMYLPYSTLWNKGMGSCDAYFSFALLSTSVECFILVVCIIYK